MKLPREVSSLPREISSLSREVSSLPGEGVNIDIMYRYQ